MLYMCTFDFRTGGYACVCVYLPFSLLHTRPTQPYDPPRSGLPPPCGPAGSRVRGNTRSGPYCSAASQPGRDPTARKDDKKMVGLKSSMEDSERWLWRR